MAYHKRITAIPSRQLVGDHHMATNWYSWPLYDNTGGGPCPPPTLDEFRIRFPEFADVSDDLVQLSIDDASCRVNGDWACCDCTNAIAFLAAHYLALQKLATDVIGTGDGSGSVIGGGQVTSIAFESMKVSFSAPTFAGGGGGGGGSSGSYPLGSTPYGQRYLSILKANEPAVLIV